MAPDDQVGANSGASYTLNQLLSSAGLVEYLEMLDSKGCRTPEDLGLLSPAEVKILVRHPRRNVAATPRALASLLHSL